MDTEKHRDGDQRKWKWKRKRGIGVGGDYKALRRGDKPELSQWGSKSLRLTQIQTRAKLDEAWLKGWGTATRHDDPRSYPARERRWQTRRLGSKWAMEELRDRTWVFKRNVRADLKATRYEGRRLRVDETENTRLRLMFSDGLRSHVSNF